MSPLIRAVIDTQALRSNLTTLRALAPLAQVTAVIKANAYGHGLVPTARALDAADAFGVARIEEGIALRAAGISQPILLLEGVFTPQQMAAAARHDFELVVHDPVQIELLEKFTGAERFIVWIKIDTGMNRLGFRVQDFPRALERVLQLPTPAREVRLLTHLARADEPDVAATSEQLQQFKSATLGLGFRTSIANSAGILAWPEAHSDWIRPGVALYGASPFADKSAASLGLVPAMRLETTVIATRRVARGGSVGYGGTWQAARDTTLAILAGGYGDGLPRSLASGTPVLVNGERAPLVGRVSMDMIAVEIGDRQDVHVGTGCVLWGEGLAVEEIAAHAGTIAYEVLCGVNQRVPREFR